MTKTAKIISIENGIAILECERESACSMCENAATCAEKGKVAHTRATNDIGAKIGDTVEIETDTGNFLLYAFLVFILPVIVSFCLYFVFRLFLGSGLVAVATIFSLVLLMILFSVLLNKKASEKPQSRIVSIKSVNN